MSADTDLLGEGLLDSLAMAEMLLHFEAAYGIRIEIEDLDLETFRSIQSMASYVARHGRRG